MALDDLIKRRFAKRAAQKFSKGRFTATQTGAKKLASDRTYGGYVANVTRGGVKGGIGEPAPSQEDIESMVKKSK